MQTQMTNARADISLMQIADEIYEKNYEEKDLQLILMQNISVCQIDEENNENDTDKKFINSQKNLGKKKLLTLIPKLA